MRWAFSLLFRVFFDTGDGYLEGVVIDCHLIPPQRGLFIATQINGNWRAIKQALNDHPLTSIVLSEGVVMAGSAEGILRSTDATKTWEKASEGLAIPYIRWMASSSNHCHAYPEYESHDTDDLFVPDSPPVLSVLSTEVD
jgi:hypothetical protein